MKHERRLRSARRLILLTFLGLPLNQEITTALALAKRKERSYNIGQT